MSIFRTIGREFQYYFGHWKRAIPVLAILLVPILYAGTFLWAFWDPYGHLSRMPVAVVNEDRGTTSHGTRVDAGAQLIHHLNRNRSFDWRFVTRRNAEFGMQQNQYYMTVIIPSDFSAQSVRAMSNASGPKPRLIAITNDRYNYIASIIGRNAMVQVQQQVAGQLTKEFTGALVTGMQRLGEGYESAASGASAVAQGASRLASQSGNLQYGAGQVAQGAEALTAGIDKASRSAKQLAAGSQAFESGLNQLNTGLGKLGAAGQPLTAAANQVLQGLSQLRGGLTKTSQGASKVAQGATQLASGLAGYAKVHPDISTDPQFHALLAASQQVATGAGQMASGQSQLSQSTARLQQGQTKLATGISQFNARIQQATAGSQRLVANEPPLVTGIQRLASGLGSIATGANRLKTGALQLESGVGKFQGGVVRVANGSTQLANQLNQATRQLPSIHRNSWMSAAANPVALQMERSGDISYYGQGFTPYFLSLGLYVGVLLMSIVVSFRDPVGEPKSGISWFASKFFLIGSVAVIQSWIADAILLLGLGLPVQNVPHFVLFSMLTSLAFAAIIQFLVTTMANPGRFLAVVLLILQLTASSGTYPVILSPPFFQNIHPWVPMTYSVDGFRFLVGGGNLESMKHDVRTLSLISVVFLALTCLYFIMRYRSIKRGKSGERAEDMAEA